MQTWMYIVIAALLLISFVVDRRARAKRKGLSDGTPSTDVPAANAERLGPNTGINPSAGGYGNP